MPPRSRVRRPRYRLPQRCPPAQPRRTKPVLRARQGGPGLEPPLRVRAPWRREPGSRRSGAGRVSAGPSEGGGSSLTGPRGGGTLSSHLRCSPSASVAAGGAAPPEGAMSNGVYALPSAANGEVKPVVSSTPLVDFLMQLEDYTPTVGYPPE